MPPSVPERSEPADSPATSSRIPMQALQRVDKALGLLACALLQPLKLTRPFRRGASAERVLLIKFWGLGSLQLLTPAARALRRSRPSAQLTLLTLRENEAFARGLGVFDEVLTLDVATQSWPSVFRRILGLVRELRARRFGAVYDFEFFTRFSAVITLLTGAPESHGFASPSVWRGRIHTHTTPFNRYWHVARNFRGLAGGENGLDIDAGDLARYRVSPADEAELDAVLAETGLGSAGPLAVLNPNAGSLSLERRWPRPHFAELARRLHDEDGARICLIGSPSEVDWTAGVEARVGELEAGRFANLAGKLSVGAVQALLARADVFVSNDSGPMHLAAARGTPTIGLFGPETPVMYAPIGERSRALYKPPACSPCINVHDNKVANCVRGQPECLMNLTSEEVLDEARAQLRRTSLRSYELPRAQPPAVPELPELPGLDEFREVRPG